jgi:hypothetical protein
MKSQRFFLLIIFLLLIPDLFCDENKVSITSKSYFSVPALFRPASPEMVSIRRDQLNIYNDQKSIIDVIIYGGQSVDPDKLAKYFLPFNKTKVIAGELGSQAVKKGNVDLIANYFGVLTSAAPQVGEPVEPTIANYTFQSELSFKPKQSFVGAVFTYKQHLSRYTDKGFWFEVVAPIEHVKNEVRIEEKIITEGGSNGNNPQVPPGSVPNMTAAFKQKSWRFGKIDGPQSITGVADLYVRLGYTYMREETHHLNSYFGFSFPTGNVPNGEFVFEPVIGNDGHLTLFGGTSGGFKIWSSCDKSVYFEFDTVGTLFAENEQTRSLDLKDKSWSRYMWVYLDKKSTTTHPGINVFTHRVHVNPSTSRDLTTAFVYRDCKGFQAELGYHFYARQAEEVKLAKTWKKTRAIASIIKNGEFIAGGISRDNATINEYLRIGNDTVDGQEVYKPIEESDLDFDSASHPGVLSHTGYGALSYNWDNCKHPKFVGLGGSYEFSSNNSALSRWMLWARFGISF